MNTTPSSQTSSENNFKQMHSEFSTWSKKWLNKSNEETNELKIDLPDVINLLRAIGYQIVLVDVSASKEDYKLRGEQEGNRIVATCSHSGQRFILEKPGASTENCTCLSNETSNNKDCFWEVSAQTSNSNSVVEVGCDLITNPSKEQLQLTKIVAETLIRINRDDGVKSEPVFELNSNSFVTPQIPKSKTHVRNVTNETYSTGIESPNRYRSLDTLTAPGSVQDELLNPVIEKNTLPANTRELKSLIETASNSLNKALKLFDVEKTREYKKSRTVSSPNLTQTSSLVVRPGFDKSPKSALSTRSSSTVAPKSRKSLGTCESIDKKPARLSLAPSKPDGARKYAHVKSTISRITDFKKK